MARIELTRTFPVEAKQSWDYMNDPHHWPEWFVNLVSVENPEARWSEPGDSVRFSYRLMGRKLTGENTIEEREAPTSISYTAKIPGMPDVHHEWRHSDLGSAITTTVVLETDKPAGLLRNVLYGKLMPMFLERDLRRTLDNLDRIFTDGLPE